MPSARNTMNAKAITGPPPSEVQSDRAKLIAGDVCVGSIVWLPKQLSNSQGLQCIKTGCSGILNSKGYNHPVVIMGIKQVQISNDIGDLIITIALVTGFGHLSLSEYRTRPRSERKVPPSIPIINHSDGSSTPAESDASTALRLENRKTLYKQSYVRLDHVYNISFDLLRSYSNDMNGRAYQWRLDEVSYHRLANLLHLKPETYQPTSNLSETEAMRPQLLADQGVIPDHEPSARFQQSVDVAGVPSLVSASAAPNNFCTDHIPPMANQQQGLGVSDLCSQTSFSHSDANYGTIRGLPTPVIHTSRRQRDFPSLAMIILTIFWLLMIYTGWWIYRTLSKSG